MRELYTEPPKGFTEPFPDGSQWVHRTGAGRVFSEVVGVLYDQTGIREADKIVMVSHDPTGNYRENPQYREGKITVRTRKDVERNWNPKPADTWVQGAVYRQRTGNRTAMKVVHVYNDGSALLVWTDGAMGSLECSAENRINWRESELFSPDYAD